MSPDSQCMPATVQSVVAAEAVGDVGLVVGAVEHRPQVVGHAAVDRDVGAHARDLLDRADRVDRHARVADQRAARLAEHGHVSGAFCSSAST